MSFLDSISRKAEPLPAMIWVYGPPGTGKTSLGCATLKPVFMIDDQEDGINTLKGSGLVPASVPVLPACSTWQDVMGQFDELATSEHDFKTLVIDTLGGLERLCHDHECKVNYKGVRGDKGFDSYAQGYQTALAHWREMLGKIDRLRRERKMMIVALSHSIVRPHKNPLASDYDRYVPDMHHKTTAVTEKFCDMMLFLNYVVVVSEDGLRPKGHGGQDRIINTEWTAAFSAKNRHNLPDEISMGTSGPEAWKNLVDAIKSSRKAVK